MKLYSASCCHDHVITETELSRKLTPKDLSVQDLRVCRVVKKLIFNLFCTQFG